MKQSSEGAWFVAAIIGGLAAVIVVIWLGARHENAIEEQQAHNAAEATRLAWEGPCHDVSWLLATTAGSPSEAACPNKLHRMHVEVATHPSNEEAAAIVFCECVHEPPKQEK